jgi:endonuclease-3
MEDKKRKLKLMLKLLKQKYGKDMHTFLDFSNPWQLLVATILSAQAQDAQVNKATAKLFKEHPTVKDYTKMTPSQLYKYIKTIGLYKGKGKNILKTSKIVVSQFDSRVPRSIAELITLPGVGRKTANVVLANAHGIHEGIAIDTHCITVANRLGFARSTNPIKIEQSLMKISDQSEWNNINHLFIALGRDTCTARRKYCGECVLRRVCPSSDAK